MTEENEIKDTAVILPSETTVVLGEETINVAQFKLGKSLRIMENLAELLEGGELVAVIKAAQDGPDALWGVVSDRLPSLIRTARPLVFRTLALALISNKRLAEIDENEESYEAELRKWTRVLKEEADTEKALQLMMLAIDGIGFDAIRKNFPKLRQKLGST